MDFLNNIYAIIILHDVTFIYANQIELPDKRIEVNQVYL